MQVFDRLFSPILNYLTIHTNYNPICNKKLHNRKQMLKSVLKNVFLSFFSNKIPTFATDLRNNIIHH